MARKCHTELQEVSGVYRRLQRVKVGVQGVTRDYKEIKWVTGDYSG